MSTLTGLNAATKKHISDIVNSTNANIKRETSPRGTKLTIVVGFGTPYVIDTGYILNRSGQADAKAFLLALVVLTSRQPGSDSLSFNKASYREYAERNFRVINKHIRQIENRHYENEDPFPRIVRTSIKPLVIALSGIACMAMLTAATVS